MGLKHSEAGMMKIVVVLVIMASLAASPSVWPPRRAVPHPRHRTATAAVSSVVNAARPRRSGSCHRARDRQRHPVLRGQPGRDALLRGGGGIDGPGRETNISSNRCAPPKVGYDCMSLAQYAVYQGTGQQVVLPDNGARPPAEHSCRPGRRAGPAGMAPRRRRLLRRHHRQLPPLGIYAGDGEVWDAFDNGVPVQEHPFGHLQRLRQRLDGAYRYGTVSHRRRLPVRHHPQDVLGHPPCLRRTVPYSGRASGSKAPAPGSHARATGCDLGQGHAEAGSSWTSERSKPRTAATPKAVGDEVTRIKIA